jgi:hypothetical protein
MITATSERKITKPIESPNSENVSIDDNFIYGGENNICEVCCGLFKRAKENGIIKVDTRKMKAGIKIRHTHRMSQ